MNVCMYYVRKYYYFIYQQIMWNEKKEGRNEKGKNYLKYKTKNKEKIVN